VICVTKFGQPVTATSKSSTRNEFMNWLKKIGGPLRQKLLSKVSYHKNVCVTLFIFADIGRFMHDGLSHAHGGFADFWIQVTLTNTSSVKYRVMNNTQQLSETLVSTQARHEWRANWFDYLRAINCPYRMVSKRRVLRPCASLCTKAGMSCCTKLQ
jgi:uncharacterized protein YfdQ (DUF2303 family)